MSVGRIVTTVEAFAPSCIQRDRGFLPKLSENPMSVKSSSRARHLASKFGITEAQYAELLESQGGSCFICGKTPEEEGKNLAVDHDHKTGEIRGVLCGHCNHRIVGRHRDPDLLRRVAEYLERHTGWFVPKKAPRPRKRKARKA